MKDFLFLVSAGIDDTVIGEYADEPVNVTLRYAQPYDPDFSCVKEFRKKMRRYSPYNDPIDFAVDITAWMGHHNEEYFTVLAEFLCDMNRAYGHRFIFLVKEENMKKAGELFTVLRCYMDGELVSGKETEKKGVKLTPEAAELLNGITAKIKMNEVGKKRLADAVIRDIGKASARHIVIGAEDIYKYARRDNSALKAAVTEDELAEIYKRTLDKFKGGRACA